MRRGKLFGIGVFEVVIHVAVTIAAAAAVGSLPGRPAELGVAAVFIASLLFLAARRRRALRENPDQDQPGDRMEDLEYRVAELEQVQERVLELEERLDFAERLLARQRAQESLPEGR